MPIGRKKGESVSAYRSRVIKHEKDKHPNMPIKQAVAIGYSESRASTKKKGKQ